MTKELQYVKKVSQPRYVYSLSIEGRNVILSEEQANKLYDELGEVLGKSPFPLKQMHCDDRFSHSPHVEIKQGVIYYCTGRSFDAT